MDIKLSTRRQKVKCHKLITVSGNKTRGEVGAIMIEFWYVFFSADYTVFDKLFELCPFMQTVVPHENHVDIFPSSYPVTINHEF